MTDTFCIFTSFENVFFGEITKWNGIALQTWIATLCIELSASFQIAILNFIIIQQMYFLMHFLVLFDKFLCKNIQNKGQLIIY